jgi:DNA-binding transcriptional regulator YiaG
MDTIKDLRTATGMTQKAFSEYFGIPKRNIENWEGGKSKCPPYLFDLMRYKLTHENKIDPQYIGTEE